MRKSARPSAGRLARMVRGWRPDRNPLRRVFDRAEAAIGAGLVMVFLAGAPLLGTAAGQWAYDGAHQTQLAQRAVAHPASAVLLRSAPPPVLTARALAVAVEEPARWTAPRGAVRTGEIVVPAGTKAGTLTQVWIDALGRLTAPPLPPSQLTDQVVLAALFACAGFAVLLAGGWLITRRVLHARRLAWWEARWSAVGPTWTSRR